MYVSHDRTAELDGSISRRPGWLAPLSYTLHVDYSYGNTETGLRARFKSIAGVGGEVSGTERVYSGDGNHTYRAVDMWTKVPRCVRSSTSLLCATNTLVVQ